MPWIQRLAHDDFPPDPAHVGVPGGPCEKLGPAGTAVPCRRDLDFREDVERDLATEEGNSLVRRTDTKVSLKQVASANATAVTSGTASMNATSASDSAAAAVVMSTVPSDVVPWNTAILRWNECQSICLNFCYTVNIPDTNTWSVIFPFLLLSLRCYFKSNSPQPKQIWSMLDRLFRQIRTVHRRQH